MKVKEKTLSQLARKPGSRPGKTVCRICLAAETFTRGGSPA